MPLYFYHPHKQFECLSEYGTILRVRRTKRPVEINGIEDSRIQHTDKALLQYRRYIHRRHLRRRLTSELTGDLDDETAVIVKAFDGALVAGIKEDRTLPPAGVPKVVLDKISLFVGGVLVGGEVEMVQFLVEVFFFIRRRGSGSRFVASTKRRQ